MTVRCSVGITAYNEEANIGKLLEAMLDAATARRSRSPRSSSSPAAAPTTPCRSFRNDAARDPRIRLIVQETARGQDLRDQPVPAERRAKTICVLESGDTLPRADSIENLVRMFADPDGRHDRRAENSGQHARARRRLSVRTCACSWSTSSAWRSRAWAS